MTNPSRPLPEAERATSADLLAHSVWVRRIARALVGDATSADDVVQDMWIRALTHPPATDRPLRPWLARVLARVAHNRRRADRRRAEHEEAQRPDAESPAPHAIAASIEMQRMLLDEIEKLGEVQRSTLVRHYFQGLTAGVIAQQDGVSETTVRNRIAQSIEVLRKQLDDRHHGDRAAWATLVMPSATHGPGLQAAAAKATSAASTTGALIAMNVLVKIGVAAVVLVAGLGVYELTEHHTDFDADKAVPATAGDTALAPAPSSGASALSTNRVGLSIDEATMQASRSMPADAVVEAHVIDVHGAPIAGATMTCVTRRDGPSVPDPEFSAVTSDADGRLRMELKVATRPVQPDEPEAEPASTMWWVDLELAAAGHVTVLRPISYSSAQTISLGDIVLADGGDVAGRVVDGSGRGIGAALVTCIASDLSIEDIDEARTFGLFDSDPQAQVRTLADGSYVIHGITTGSHRVWTMPEASTCALSDAFVIQGGDRIDVPALVVEEDPAAITGVVLTPDGRPCREALVSTAVNGVCEYSRTRTGDDGRFTHKVAAGATVELEVEAVEGDAIVAGVRAGTRDLHIVLKAPRWIDVHVQDPAGIPLSKFTLRMEELKGRGNSTWGMVDRKDGTGRIRASVRPFSVLASAEGRVEETSGTIDPTSVPEELSFQLESYPSLRGRVMLRTRGIAGAEVSLLRVLGPDEHWTMNGVPATLDALHGFPVTSSGADGSFSFTLRKGGTFVLCASTVQEYVQDGLVLESRTASERTASGATEPLTIDAAHPPGDVVIRLTNGGSLEGSIRMQPGDETSFGWLQVVHLTGETHSVAIDAGGRFRFDRLAPGTWWILRVESELREGLTGVPDRPANPTAREVRIAEGEITHFDLDLRSQPAPVLIGRFSIAGESSAAWTARMSVRDSWMTTSDKAPVSADGTFRLRLRATGDGTLVLDTATTPDRARRIEADVPLEFGENRWSLDVPTGSLEVVSHSTRAGVLSHVCALAGGAKFVAEFKLDAGSSVRLDHVAAGHAQIVDASGKVLAEVDVPSGGEAHVTLP